MPAVGATSPTAARASVDLPQPDSPTRPTIWPALDRRGSRPRRRARGRRRGARSRRRRREPRARSSRRATGRRGRRAAGRRSATSGGTCCDAALLREGAARMERAARTGSSPGSAARPAIATSGLSLRRLGMRQRVEQRARVRMARRCAGRPRASPPRRPPGVEDRHAVGDRRHHAEVVRDQDDREVVLAAQAVEQPQDARLHGHVERGRRLVGDQQLRAGRRARSRSRSAGACRRRTGAGTRAAPRRDPGSGRLRASASALPFGRAPADARGGAARAR